MPTLPADTHVPPAIRRWTARLGLAVVVAVVIGYLPGQVLSRDPRSVKLEDQLGTLADQEAALITHNAAMVRAIEAMRSDVGAIEDRARADLGMTYPDELLIRVPPEGTPVLGLAPGAAP